MKRTNNTDDSTNGGCLSTITDARKSADYAYKKASSAVFDSERDRLFEIAARHHYRAEVLARGDA